MRRCEHEIPLGDTGWFLCRKMPLPPDALFTYEPLEYCEAECPDYREYTVGRYPTGCVCALVKAGFINEARTVLLQNWLFLQEASEVISYIQESEFYKDRWY